MRHDENNAHPDEGQGRDAGLYIYKGGEGSQNIKKSHQTYLITVELNDGVLDLDLGDFGSHGAGLSKVQRG